MTLSIAIRVFRTPVAARGTLCWETCATQLKTVAEGHSARAVEMLQPKATPSFSKSGCGIDWWFLATVRLKKGKRRQRTRKTTTLSWNWPRMLHLSLISSSKWDKSNSKLVVTRWVMMPFSSLIKWKKYLARRYSRKANCWSWTKQSLKIRSNLVHIARRLIRWRPCRNFQPIKATSAAVYR